VNQRSPSGPGVIPNAVLLAVGMVNSVSEAWMAALLPASGLISPILLPNSSANQRLPSGPAVILNGALLGVGTLNSENACVAGLNRSIWSSEVSANQRFPSAPVVIPSG